MPLNIDLTDDRVDTARISLEYELEALQRAVQLARQTGGGDTIEPEFEDFLAALANPAPVQPAVLAGPGGSRAANPWRE